MEFQARVHLIKTFNVKCVTHFVQMIKNSNYVYQNLYQVPRVAVTRCYNSGWFNTTEIYCLRVFWRLAVLNSGVSEIIHHSVPLLACGVC